MVAPRPNSPEERARVLIDEVLARAGWDVQNRADMNLSAARGVTVREFPMARGHGFVDYLLFVDERAVGVLEAKPQGHTLSGVQTQAERYSSGLPPELKVPIRPLPFVYSSTGSETLFANLLDPEPRSRGVFAPGLLAEVRGPGVFGKADDVCFTSQRGDEGLAERGLVAIIVDVEDTAVVVPCFSVRGVDLDEHDLGLLGWKSPRRQGNRLRGESCV
jgi:hypothetical protein